MSFAGRRMWQVKWSASQRFLPSSTASSAFPTTRWRSRHARSSGQDPTSSGTGLKQRSPKRLAAADSSTTSNRGRARSEEHTSELQSLMRISYAVFCLKKKKTIEKKKDNNIKQQQHETITQSDEQHSTTHTQ